jgi:cathepsin D
VNGKSVVGSTAAIFDSGTTQIVGDPKSIANFFKPIKGAQAASKEYGEGSYTSAFSSTTDQPARLYIYIFNTLVPCTFDTPISIDVGGKTVNIPPASFNLGPVSPNSSTCMAGVAADPNLTGGELFFGIPS